jgi:hypothetical protein
VDGGAIAGAGHFLAEDAPGAVGAELLSSVGARVLT